MSYQNMPISVTAVDPKSLSDDDIHSLSEVMQDMWADGIWEFVQCSECDHMHSKQDIYEHLKQEHYQCTVRAIMWDFEVDNIPCQQCSWSTRPVFGRANIEVVRDRLMNTRKAFLAVARNKRDEIVGFEDAYIGTLESIFDRELETHYRIIGIAEIRDRITRVLSYEPPELLVLSDIGLLSRYRSFQNIYHILSSVAQTMTPEYDSIPGFTEIDEGNSLHTISSILGWVSLGIRQDPRLGEHIINTGHDYQSDLIVYNWVASIYRNSFSWSAKSLVRLIRSSRFALAG